MKRNKFQLLGVFALLGGLILYVIGAFVLGSSSITIVALSGMAILLGIPMLSLSLKYL